jgi:FixJ family two-component response regulator
VSPFVDFIEKPFDDEALLASIQRAADRAGEAASAAAGKRVLAVRLDALSGRERDVLDGGRRCRVRGRLTTAAEVWRTCGACLRLSSGSHCL